LPIEHAIRRVLLAHVERIRALRLVEVEREPHFRSTPACGGGALVLVDRVSLERGEQEPAKPPPRGIGGADVASFDEAEKESLGQVLRVRGIVSAASQVAVERGPVALAELFEGRGGVGIRLAAGSVHHRPSRRGKAAAGGAGAHTSTSSDAARNSSGSRGRRARSVQSADLKSALSGSLRAASADDTDMVSRKRSAAGIVCRNGCRAVSISNAITPSAQRSQAGLTSSPATCSGAMYSRVPRSSPALVLAGARSNDAVRSNVLARPKSSTFGTTPPAWRSRKMFSGLRSRWTSPRPCAALSAAH